MWCFSWHTVFFIYYMGSGNRFHILSFFFFFSLWVECTRGRNRTQLFIRALTQTIISSLDTNFLLKKTLFHFSLPQVNIFSLIFIDNWWWWRLGNWDITVKNQSQTIWHIFYWAHQGDIVETSTGGAWPCQCPPQVSHFDIGVGKVHVVHLSLLSLF